MPLIFGWGTPAPPASRGLSLADIDSEDIRWLLTWQEARPSNDEFVDPSSAGGSHARCSSPRSVHPPDHHGSRDESKRERRTNQGPHVKACESAPHIGVIQVQRDSPELCELRHLPEDD